MHAVGIPARRRAAPVASLRDDAKTYEAVLSDLPLFRTVMDHDAPLARISARLFFSILLLRARPELAQSRLTMEVDIANELADSHPGRITGFIRRAVAINYLLAVRVSFVRIEHCSDASATLYCTLACRILNCFDLEGLIVYCVALADRARFDAWRQIGVLSLFFAGTLGVHGLRPGGSMNPRLLSISETRRADFFSLPARNSATSASSLGRALQSLSERLSLANKPLRLVSSPYLGSLHDSLFAR